MLIPVVLSGGSGTRLWPVSREGHPKPFMRMPSGATLLQGTYERAAALAPGCEILTITNRDYYFLSRDEFQRARTTAACPRFILEPSGRNTAPAVAIAALYIKAVHGEQALALVMPADQLILKTDAFQLATARAAQAAEAGELVTFGIEPDRPETGFGYIEVGAPAGIEAVYEVKRFVEKPDAAKARAFVDSRSFLWNSGMFCFRAAAMLRELAEHAPDVLRTAQECCERLLQDEPLAEYLELPREPFMRCPSVSIDVAVMEKAKRVKVVRSDIGWSDVGSWEAVSRLLQPDDAGNTTSGDTVVVDARNNFIYADERVVAALGVSDLMVIDTADALLVAAKDRAQDVKKVVEVLKQRGHESFRLHRTVSRPWGTFTVLEEGPRFKIKRIVVKPGGSLSLQMHHHRSEHWIVVKGTAKVTNENRETFLYTDQSTYIPAGNRHRLENPGKVELVLIEVQSGDYVGEDDIVRFNDVYGRAEAKKTGA